jgi:hypothetical protein
MGDSGKSAQAPQYDSSQTRQTGADQIANTISGAQQIVPVLGNLDRSQAGLNDQFSLRRMVSPGETFYAKEFGPANKTLTALKGAATRVKNGQTQYRVGDKWISAEVYQTRLSNAQTKVTEIQNRPITELTGAFADQFAARDKLLGSIDSAQASSPEYLRMQEAYGRGISAQTLGQRSAALSQANAAGMGQVADVRAQQVGAGALGDRLMGEALRRVDLNGRLSAQDERDVSQATRSGMAARGMATGSAGLGAELLNRDRFSRQRAFQDLGFAQGVQEQDIGRQFNNVGNVLRADQGNQQTQFGREQIISGNQQQANLANMQAANQMAQYNTTLGATTDQFNAQALDSTNRYNIGLIGTSAQMADAEQARNLNLQQNAYNFGLQTDPRMMLAGMGSPLSNMTGLGAQLANVNLSPMYSGGQFSGQGGGGFDMMGAGTGALSGAATGAMLGSVVPGIGTAAGAIGGGLIGGLGGGLSDKREKTDIKPLGTLTSVLKIPAYEYRYKGEKKKRKGVMAQDVQKVLPEAVTEVDYQGKRRLAIKPGVIGAALAEELTNQTKAVAA